MKKLITLCMSVLLLWLLVGCITDSESRHHVNEKDQDTLRICIDSIIPATDYDLKKAMTEWETQLQTACDMENLIFEVLPYEGAERKTALMRLRTEILAGGGPDVFIMRTTYMPFALENDPTALFKFPEKNMEAGLFLPLDTYMQNSSQFTYWDVQTKAVLDAGRTKEGQVVIPMAYTFSVLTYPKHEAELPYTTALTMRDVLDNPETKDIGKLLYSDILQHTKTPSSHIVREARQLSYILGKTADYEQDQLLFSEEELYETLRQMLSLYDDAAENQNEYIKNQASYNKLIDPIYKADFSDDMTLLPLYSKDGGVTATITAYAAVNRNTMYPKEAFTVIDYLMQEKMQQESILYNRIFVNGLPLQNDLGSKEKPLMANSTPQSYLEEALYTDFLAIKDQISAVNFENELNTVLGELALSCVYDEAAQDPSVLETYVSEAYKKMERMMGE